MKKVLIVNPFGIGDVIFTMTALEALRASIPDLQVGFLCNERTQSLVRLNTSIDHTFVFNRDHFRKLWADNKSLFFRELKGLLSLIRDEKFDTVLDFSLGREYSFLAWWIGIKTRVGLNYKGRGFFLNHKKSIDGYSDRHVVDTQLSLLDDLKIAIQKPSGRLPIKISDETKKECAADLKKMGVLESDPYFLVAPGGGKSWGENAIYKQWNPEFFAQAASQAAESKNYKVILIGDETELDLMKQVKDKISKQTLIVAGESLEKVAAMMTRSKFLLCNDGGLLHLANALGVKTVSVFGPVDQKVYGPYGEHVDHQVVTTQVACRPCYQKFHFPACQFNRQCLTQISVAQVLEAIQKIA